MTEPEDDLIERVYDIAVAPERLEHLVDAWSRRLGPAGEPLRLALLAEPELLRHVQRGERVLRELMAITGEERNSARDWADANHAAAVVVNRSAVVLAANAAAMHSLELKPGNTLAVLPVHPDDLALLTEMIGDLPTAMDADLRLVRLRKGGDVNASEAAPILVRIVEAVGGDPQQIGLVTSILSWPPHLSVQLTGSFGLTAAEAEVLKELTLGAAVKEIAGTSDRREATVRSHVKALLAKTGTRSQMEMVRLTLGLLDAGEQNLPIVPMRGPPGIEPEPNRYNTIKMADGRQLDFLDIGDPRGRPFLMLPTDMGFTRLPPPAERWLTQSRMRMIVPVRAGYGYSSPLPRRRNAYEVAVEDMFALCDHLRIDTCPILAQCDDFHLAVQAACTAPERVSGIVALGPLMPATRPEHFRRMQKWTRFIIGTVQYAPRALPYVTMAFFQCARRLGPRRFMEMVVTSSKADLAVLADDEMLTAMLRGTEIAIGPRFTAHDAWAAGTLANFGTDWSSKLAGCPVPMVLFAGHQDPFAPFETTREFVSNNPRITLHAYPQYGQLLYPLWREFLAAVQQQLRN
jgi:pimeloyl-ACP methyl ester carboxylesterase/DNA-binding CsgD family transcriptional regulator